MTALLGSRLRFDRHAVTATILTTLLLLVDAYFPLTASKSYDRLILYLAIPLLTILLIYREGAAKYGFTAGDWKVGIPLTLMGMLLVTPIIWVAARQPSMQQYYEAQLGGLPWSTFVDLLGWEFVFRGFLLFSYARKYGEDALWLQAVPFALAHIGKPAVETLSTLFGGFAFGWLAYRTRSFIYPFLLHWYVATLTIVVAAGALG